MTILKIGHLAKAIAYPKPIALEKWSVKVKNYTCRKTCVKRFYSHIKVVTCKKKKNTQKRKKNIREMRRFFKLATLQRLEPMQRLLLFQNGPFGSKIKLPKLCKKGFYNHIRVALRKKLLEKNTKYSRSEMILKIGHL